MKKYLNGILVDMTSEEEKEIKAIQDAYDEDAVKLEDLRAVRDGMLSNSDWTQYRDVTLSNDADWKTYRQELRDITKTYKSLEDVKWPTAPKG